MAPIKQYLRKWSMLINGEPFIDSRDGHQFRVIFDIDVNPGNTLTLCDIQIYNLSNDTTINQRDDIVFSAGYENEYDILFVGTVTNIFKERRGPDVITRLLCRSGIARERGYMASGYGPGARLTDVLVDAAKSWPLALVIDLSQFDDKDVFPAGWTARGDVAAVLDDLQTMFDFRWVQDRGSLVITRPDKERGSTVFTIDQFSGMVGMPEVTRGPQGLGVNVTTRINPYIRANSRIEVKSQFSTYNTGNMMISEIEGDTSANGIFNVLSIKYSGDSHGTDWDMKIEAIRAGTRDVVTNKTGGKLVWGGVVEPEFRAKVRQIAAELNLDPNWLMAVMAFETGETFSPSIPNKAGSGAVGLIQFIPTTAKGLGTSTKELANMTRLKQLDYVKKYYQQYASRIKNIGDAYMAVFLPAIGIGVPDSTVLIDKTTKPTMYDQNRGLDISHDGKITRGEAIMRVHRAYKKGLMNKG